MSNITDNKVRELRKIRTECKKRTDCHLPTPCTYGECCPWRKAGKIPKNWTDDDIEALTQKALNGMK